MSESTRTLILVVDDDDDVREMILEALADAGFRAAGARDGREALAWLLDHEAPAVIFLDLMMPRMSGEEFRRAQLQEAVLADVPVVVVSADARADAKSVELGAAYCLRKPMKMNELIAVARRFAPPSIPVPASQRGSRELP